MYKYKYNNVEDEMISRFMSDQIQQNLFWVGFFFTVIVRIVCL